MSGIEVRDGDDYARLMMRARPTLGDVFRAQGYRVLALMPGLRQAWPEGDVLPFDEIYGADAASTIAGRSSAGGAFPDQFAIGEVRAARAAYAAAPQRAPRFLFFPTISSHMPFRPTPPYQPDWDRDDGTASRFGDEAARAIAQPPEWTQLGPSYGGLDCLCAAHRWLVGSSSAPAQPLVMWLLGDHQPPAAVSGEGAILDVPVHVISDRPEVLEALRARGFVPGLDPSGPAIGPMHVLGPWLISAIGTAPRSPSPAIHAARREAATPGLAVAPASLPN